MLAVALGLLATQLASPDPRIGDDDFQVFYEGAAALRAGHSPYVGDFVSPPWFALMLVPLTLLPLPTARGLWLVLNLALLFLAIAAAMRHVGLRWPARRLALASALCALWPPVEFGLRLGQNSVLVWSLLLGALLAAQRARFRLCGLLVALSMLKPHLAWLFLLGLGAWAYQRGRLRALAIPACATLVGLAALVALLAPDSYVDLIALRPRSWNYWGSTVALPPLFALALGSQMAAMLLYVPVALLAALLVVCAWGAPTRPLPYVSSITACLTLLLAPYAYPYDAILLSLPILWLVARIGGASPIPSWQTVIGSGVLLVALLALERPADYESSRLLGLLPPLLVLAAVLALGPGAPATREGTPPGSR